MKKTIFSVIFSNFLSSGIGFLINVFLARYLSVEEYGRINLVFSFIIILFSLFEFNFGNAVIIFYKRMLNEFEGNDENIIFFSNRLFLKYLPLSLAFLIVSLFILKKMYLLTTLEMVIVVVNFYLFLLYRYIVNLQQTIGNWFGFNLLNVINNIIKSLAMLFAVLVLTMFTSSYEAILIGNGIFPVIVLLVSLFYSKSLLKIIKLPNEKDLIKIFNSIIIPLGISNIFIIISMRADTLIIEKVLGPRAVGIYAAANILALMFPLITSAIRNVFMREGAGVGDVFLRQLLNQQKKYGKYLVLLLVIALLLAKPVFHLLYGARYEESILIFQILLIAYIGGIFFTPLESYFYSQSPQAIRNLKFVQMIIIVFCSLILIQFFGIIGVAISIVFSRLYGCVYLLWNSYLQLNKK